MEGVETGEVGAAAGAAAAGAAAAAAAGAAGAGAAGGVAVWAWAAIAEMVSAHKYFEYSFLFILIYG